MMQEYCRGYKKFIKVDKDDVPELVQELEYNYFDMTISMILFNGKNIRVITGLCCPEMDLMQKRLTKYNKYEILRWVEKNFKNINRNA